MIEITHDNTHKYFDESTIDNIFDVIEKEITNNIIMLPNIGIGCMCLKNIPIKKIGERQVYVEYHYEVLGTRNKIPIPIRVKPHDITIFENKPTEISVIDARIEKIRKITTEYSKLN